MFPATVLVLLAVYIRSRNRSCGKVESPPVLRGFQAHLSSRRIGFIRRQHADFIIRKAELVGVIAMLSGSPLD
jgi:hypothetical protein